MSIERPEALYIRVADALRAEIGEGQRYPPGVQLPSERELKQRFGVSTNTVRAAIVQLKSEGLVASRQGAGVFVTQPPAELRRLDTDIVNAEGFYSMLDRQGRRPATVTTVTRGPASAEVAEWLDVPEGSEVVIRARVLRSEGSPPVGLATSYFPPDVVERAPNLADPNVSGLPRWLREAFGPTYSTDLVDARAATADEAARLEVDPGSPVLLVKGTTRDQSHRVLHFIVDVVPGGRMLHGYRYGDIPPDAPEG